MSDHSRRIAALQALVIGSVELQATGMQAVVKEELAEVRRARAVSARHRRRVLQVLHSTRALDSSLKAFTTHHGCTPKRPSLGGYLKQLTQHSSASLTSKLLEAERVRFQGSIVSMRNHYMHEAGAYPSTDAEILTLLSDMHDCLVTVLAL